jgi:hypothetical protein
MDVGTAWAGVMEGWIFKIGKDTSMEGYTKKVSYLRTVPSINV